MRRVRTILGFLALMLAAAWARPAPDPTSARWRELPPNVAVASVALGGLNGLIADVLWLRAAQQQDQGRFYEMQQTAAWIAALQPGLGGLDEFQAWNLAFNIAGQFPDPADRWRWVRSGLDLLLTGGLVRHADSPAPSRSIALILDGKLVSSLDQASDYYRARWAAEWGEILGARPDLDRLSPAARERLVGTWRMSAERVAAIDRRYGPFDWRAPEPHVVYWTTLALDRSGESGDLRLERLLYQTLWSAFQQGRLVLSPGQPPLRTPDLAILPVVERELARIRARFPNDPGLAAAARNLGIEAVLYLHVFGSEPAARRRFERLRAASPGDPALALPYPDFLLAALGLEVTDATSAIDASYTVLGRVAALRAGGDTAQAAGLARLARESYQRNRRRYGGEWPSLAALAAAAEADQRTARQDATAGGDEG